MKLKRVIILLCLTSVACNNGGEISPTSTSPIEFLPQGDFQNSPLWLQEVADDSGLVELDLWGIYVFDEETLFLFGGLETAIFSFRTMLLRSDDSGRTWQEVMQPEPGSDVVDVTFTENGYGWALILWTIETPGLGRLFRTTDYGKSWQKVSDIPNIGGLSYPTSVHLTDEQSGEVRINDNELSCKVLTSIDGGYSWEEGITQLSNDACYIQISNQAVGFDGSQWQFEPEPFDLKLSENGVVKISRLNASDDWVVMSEIPKTIPYSITKSDGTYSP